jgi:hypothetical protein
MGCADRGLAAADGTGAPPRDLDDVLVARLEDDLGRHVLRRIVIEDGEGGEVLALARTQLEDRGLDADVPNAGLRAGGPFDPEEERQRRKEQQNGSSAASDFSDLTLRPHDPWVPS